MKIKIWFFSLFWLLILGLCGCGTQKPEISAQDYNNALVALQESALQVTKDYYAALDEWYDGRNLSELYEELQNNLLTLADKAEQFSGYGSDSSLKYGVLAYITGLQASLNLYEKPTVELLESYTGSAQLFYEQDQQKISSGFLALANDLALLDAELDRVQAQFVKKYKLTLAQ